MRGYNLACALAFAAPLCAQWPAIQVQRLVGGVTQPTHVAAVPDGGGRLWVVEQPGRIRLVRNGVLAQAPVLDITSRVSCCGERGLLSVAFPPGFATKRYFYVNYTNLAGNTVIGRYRLTADDVADPASETVVLGVDQPFANHNGGQLAFGPDGFLYIGMGDGGSGGDPFGNGQSLGTLLGKILRIDVESGTQPYAVPPSNPFVGRAGARGEIWAYGLRNPWRFSFDRATGDLYIADVGQELYEEVDFQPAASRGGENYGWNIMEGRALLRERELQPAGAGAARGGVRSRPGVLGDGRVRLPRPALRRAARHLLLRGLLQRAHLGIAAGGGGLGKPVVARVELEHIVVRRG